MNALPSFPHLTPDDRIWRIDWFGECAYPGAVRRYAQPSIKVALSPLQCDLSDQVALSLPDSTDCQHSRETWIPIAALPMIAIGDLWQHGQPVASPDYQVESFKKLSINPESTAFVKAGLAIDEHFLLPLSHHPWHRLHTQSYCAAVTLDANHRLLVPCIELIRFYFGSSSNFLQRLFTVPLTPEKLWIKKRFNPENRHLYLALANRLSSTSVKDIGRIAESKFAWRAAAGIHASCQKATALGHPAYPYTGFPFEGLTNLIASGIWLPFGDQEKATFLAFRLRSCSHPFPFKSLSFIASDWTAKNAKPSASGAETKRYTHSRTAAQTAEASEQDSGNNKAQRHATFISRLRFPDLQHKPVWQNEKIITPNADIFLRHKDGHLEQVAIGESPWSSDVPGVDISPAEAEGIDAHKAVRLPWFVRAGLRDIQNDPVYQSPDRNLTVVCPFGKQQPVFLLPTIVDEDGVIASQLIFLDEDGSTRQRCGCFISIACKQEHTKYLLILEGGKRSEPPKIISSKCNDISHAVKIAIDK